MLMEKRSCGVISVNHFILCYFNVKEKLLQKILLLRVGGVGLGVGRHFHENSSLKCSISTDPLVHMKQAHQQKMLFW